MSDKKSHWENVYHTKTPEQVSWTQQIPQSSLNFINGLNLPKTAKIIDIGGGDSKLVDHLLELGYLNITVLDISAAALEKAKSRLGDQAGRINWIISDITEFKPTENYDLWHDRATFHFLTTSEQVERYLQIARQSVKSYLIIGTFSENGPKKCSGLDIQQYTEDQLSKQLSRGFGKLHCITEDHLTPFNTLQNFLFCSFKRTI